MSQRYENVTCAWHASNAVRLLGLAVWVLILALSAMQAAHAGVELELRAELRVAADAQLKTYRFVPADTLIQGQEIFYTVRIHNPTDKPLNEVQAVQPLPANTRYVTGSATGPGARISFSTDGGRSFVSAAELAAAGIDAPCTHIRWQLPYPLAAKAVALVRFRAVFQ